MAFESPITISEALGRMHRHEFVLPAIQREFVWDGDQICALFDSLMRGYPIGSFLSWEITAERAGDFTYYDFVRDYHELHGRHCPKLPTQTGATTAILDGQQRLTSLNIGLAGSYAPKLPRLWRTNPSAYPKRRLYLDLLSEPEGETATSLEYPFAFLTDEEAEDADEGLFQVADILGMTELDGVMLWLAEHQLGNEPAAPKRLARLHRIVHTDLALLMFREREQDIDRVVDIFVRVNSGGEPLSHSDLLLSIATAQWSKLDARERVHDLVDELNSVHHGFDFSKDLVLKTGLVLTDASDFRFRVKNFNKTNMGALEDRWDDVANALQVAAHLLARFGLSARTLPSNSILIPLADWIHRAGHDLSLVTSVAFRKERERVRSWVLRTQLKAGVFGSGLDTLLARLRRGIRDADGKAFPVAGLEAEMAAIGKAPRFEPEELEDLVEGSYGQRRTFILLTVLFPSIDVTGDFHLDHVWPKSRFTPAKLRKHGLTEEQIEHFRSRVNLAPNMQLLSGPENESKRDRTPQSWLQESISMQEHRDDYRQRHLLPPLSDDITDFPDFYESRRSLLLERLAEVLRDGLKAPTHL